MEIVIWIIFSILIFLAFVGTIIPGLPGLLLIVTASFLIKLALPIYLTWWTIVALGVFFAISIFVDFAGTIVGAKWGGASKYGIIGASIGGLLGIFLGIPGLILGPIAGALIGELLFKKKSLFASGKAGLGAGLGLAISTVVKLFIGLIMTGVLLFDVFKS